MGNLNPKAVLFMLVAIAGGYLVGSYYPHIGTDRGMAFAVAGAGLFILGLSRNSRNNVLEGIIRRY